MSKIHITIISKEALPAYYPIREEDFDLIYMLHTKETLPVAKRLKKVVEEEGMGCMLKEIEAYNSTSSKLVCDELHINHPDSEFVYNITGGTKLMSIGAFSSALIHGAKIMYTEGLTYINVLTNERTKFSFKLSFEKIYEVQGQTEKSHKDFKKDVHTLNVANKIMAFRDKYSSFFQKINKMHRENTLSTSYADEKWSFKRAGEAITVMKEGEVVFNASHPNIKKLFLEGRWWEEIVADAIYEITERKYDIRTDVEFSPKNEKSKELDKSKNEIDIVVNLGTTLLLVECKSGKFDQDTINKMAFIKNTYGSARSHSVLISYFPLSSTNPQDADICEKADNGQMYIITPFNGMSTLENMPQCLEKIINALKP